LASFSFTASTILASHEAQLRMSLAPLRALLGIFDHFKSQYEINVIDITFWQLISMISLLLIS